MDIHHAMIVRATAERLYAALTQPPQLEIWLGAPTIAAPEIGSILEVQYGPGRRILRMEVTHLEANQQVTWRILQPMWEPVIADQFVAWTLLPDAGSTLVDFRMQGWPQDDDVYASVSYKWASLMMRLKIYLGDLREIASLLPIQGKE